ncbi:uncharacterized protein DSM5745_04693 [Aspergillus mulundensis]|uniref:Uncharacterized protein n=1 Tax=Aspergillus mulundensis TaxID=1810919 RepID=A0A3D8S4G1_9EURO|nr:Uncharacterized protein DSM5745_04693 [Aspergillus mulundensis]RDW81136.1 Uncharacterized protein DSM5745_04693 [Aspergillus mulundensis]
MAISNEEAPPPRLHPAKPLPFELVQHVGIFFEESLHLEALRLLINTLSTDSNTDIPVFTPSPQHLALAATFLVHPSTTARLKTDEEQETPHVSLRMLHLVNNLVGPVNARFDLAFKFKHFEASRHGGRRYIDGTSRKLTNSERKINLDEDIPIELAQSASVWSRAEDFWHAVGWAFNCAVLHPARWKYWRIWLEFMCQVLEDDWVQRQRIMEQDPSHDDQILKDSIIVNYIVNSHAGFGRDRRILRAIFADGGASAVNEFREVFRKELKLSRKKENKDKDSRKRGAAVNVDADEYGDFYVSTDREDEGSSPGRGSKRPCRGAAARTKNDAAIPTPNPIPDSTIPDPTPSSSLLGDMASLALRQRLCHLLSIVSNSFPKMFMRLLDLYQLFVENIRHLPLPIYQAFVSPLALTHSIPADCSTLCELLLFGLRDSSAADSDEQYLTQSKLETCFLPYAAASSSLSDNVKMSITLEALLVLLADGNMIQVTEETKQLTKKGIIRRAEKAQHETRKNQVARMSEDLEWAWLGESAERLTFLVEEVIPASARVTSTAIGS